MLPSAHRMRRGSDFTLTTRRGTKVSRGRVVGYVRPCGPDEDPSAPALVGLIVGKAAGNSVERHRAARRIRHALSGQVAHLPGGSRIVVRALAGADTDPRLQEDVLAAVAEAFRRCRESSSR